MRTRTAFGSLITATAVLAVLAGSCAHLPTYMFFDPTPRAGDPQWVSCEDFETFADTTLTVRGGTGGVLTLPRGHTLRVPPTAVPAGESVDVRFMQLAGQGVAVRLRPYGHQFADTLTLTLSYDGRNCTVSPGPVSIYRLGRGTDRPQRLPPVRDPDQRPGTVQGRLDHFSGYALAR